MTAVLKTIEVAAILKVDRTTVTRYVNAGLLHPVPNMGPRTWRFTEDEVRRFLNEKQQVAS